MGVGKSVFAECRCLEKVVITKKLYESDYRVDNWNYQWRNGCKFEVSYEIEI